MKKTAKRFCGSLIVLMCSMCMTAGFAACIDFSSSDTSSSNSSSSSVFEEELEITNRPGQDTITLTDTTNTYQLSCTVDGAVWNSSDVTVATVNNGLLTLLSEGTTTISVVKGELTDSFVLHVVDERTTESVSVKNITIVGLREFNKVYIDEEVALSTEGTPVGCDPYEVEWSVANEAVATIDNDGTLKGLAAGRTTVTAKVKGSKVTVKETIDVVARNNETFDYAKVEGSSVIGEIEIVDETDNYIMEIVRDSKTGESCLSIETESAPGNEYWYLSAKFTGLTIGETYKFSFDVQSITGYFLAQIIRYEDENGRVTDASSGEIKQWDPHDFYMDDGSFYTWDWFNTDRRFENRTLNIGFVAGMEEVVFKFLGGSKPGKTYLDNLCVEVAPPAESVEVDASSVSSLMEVGETAYYMTQSTPTIAGYEMDWSVSDDTLATIDSYGKLTALEEGLVTVTAKLKGSSDVLFTHEIQIIRLPEPGLEEDFSKGFVKDKTYRGSWEITAAEEHNISLVDGRLYLTTTAAKDGASVWTEMKIQGLTPGKAYKFSFDAQVNQNAEVGGGNYHMCLFRVYKDENGYYADKGTEAIFDPMYSGDGAGKVIATADRFEVNSFYGIFVAGSETVIIKISTNPHTTATYYDNFKMEALADGAGEVVGDDTVKTSATYTITTGGKTLPGLSNITWAVDDESLASIDATTGALRVKAAGQVTVIAKYMDAVFASKLVTLEPDTNPVQDIEIDGGETLIITNLGTYTTLSTPTDCAPYVVEWTVSDTSIATIDSETGVLTPVKVGTVTVYASVVGTDIQAEKIVNIVVNGEDFSQGTVNGTNYTGGIFDVQMAYPSGGQTMELKDGRLYVTSAALNPGMIIMVKNLKPGKIYKLSYDVQMDSTVEGANYFPNKFVCYRKGDGSFSDATSGAAFFWSAADGFIANSNGGEAILTDDSRYGVNNFYGIFTPFTDQVWFRMSFADSAVAMYIDNIKVEELSESERTIVVADTVKTSVTCTLKVGDLAVPVGKTVVAGSDWSNIQWTVSDPSVATINKLTGELTVIADGTVTITAAYDSNGGRIVYATKTISVELSTAEVESIEISGEDSIYVGQSATTYTQVGTPTECAEYEVEWSVSDMSVATIDSVTGVLTPVKAGSVVVKAQVVGSSVYAEMTVEIKAAEETTSPVNMTVNAKSFSIRSAIPMPAGSTKVSFTWTNGTNNMYISGSAQGPYGVVYMVSNELSDFQKIGTGDYTSMTTIAVSQNCAYSHPYWAPYYLYDSSYKNKQVGITASLQAFDGSAYYDTIASSRAAVYSNLNNTTKQADDGSYYAGLIFTGDHTTPFEFKDLKCFDDKGNDLGIVFYEGTEELPSAKVESIEINGVDSLYVGQTATYTQVGTPTDCAPYVVEWTVSDTSIATIDSETGVLTPVKVGTVTVYASVVGTDIQAEKIVNIVVYGEDFSTGTVDANHTTYTGANIKLQRQTGGDTLTLKDGRLYIDAPSKSNGGIMITFSNLQEGKIYKLSYEIQIDKTASYADNFFPNKFLVYRRGNEAFSNFTDGGDYMYWCAADGFIRNVDGTTGCLTTEESRFEKQTFYGYFMAGYADNTQIRMSFNEAQVAMYLDNIKVELVDSADCEIVVPDTIEEETTQLTLTHNGLTVPAVSASTVQSRNINNLYWSVDNTSVATINSATGELTAVSNGTVTITVCYSIAGNPVFATKTVTVQVNF